MEANEAFANPKDRPPLPFQREDAESIETLTVEISNLNSIEKLMRTLAHKLGVSLVEAGRGK